MPVGLGEGEEGEAGRGMEGEGGLPRGEEAHMGGGEGLREEEGGREWPRDTVGGCLSSRRSGEATPTLPSPLLSLEITWSPDCALRGKPCQLFPNGLSLVMLEYELRMSARSFLSCSVSLDRLEARLTLLSDEQRSTTGSLGAATPPLGGGATVPFAVQCPTPALAFGETAHCQQKQRTTHAPSSCACGTGWKSSAEAWEWGAWQAGCHGHHRRRTGSGAQGGWWCVWRCVWGGQVPEGPAGGTDGKGLLALSWQLSPLPSGRLLCVCVCVSVRE